MISGLLEACLGCWLSLTAGGAAAADLDALLASLAREPPQSIAFIETHRSRLLKSDLRVSGVLEYRGKDSLSRVVTEPYSERTDVEGGDVRILREGRPERRYSLRRSEALGGMLAAFSSLLSGDRVALEAAFETSVGFETGGWRLELVPRERDPANPVARIRVTGAGSAPSCIAVLAENGATATVIRLGATQAEAALVADCAEPTVAR